MRVEAIFNVGSNRRPRSDHAKSSAMTRYDKTAPMHTFAECLSSRLHEVTTPAKTQKVELMQFNAFMKPKYNIYHEELAPLI